VFVRPAKPEDVEAMVSIIGAVAEEGLIGPEPPVDLAVWAQRYRDTIASVGADAAWVLDDAGRVLGSATVHERSVGVLYLAMVILPEARGRGGGRALLDAIAEHARARGAHKLDLEAWVENARAIALYASSGFEVEGLRRNHYRRRDGHLRSALLMSRLIENDGST
jgi:ribosomal protein S18 acetylase RimI-like enzyme